MYAGIRVRDTVKGMVPGHICIVQVQVCFTQGSSKAPVKSAKTPRKTSTQAAALKAQPDADKTLNMILSRLDDMKAEETVTIDLRGKSAFSDYMIVTTGRANRHVGAIAENVTKALKENGIRNIHVEGLPNCDCVDRFRRCGRARVQTRGARILQSGKVVDAKPGGGGDLNFRPMQIG